MQRIRRHARTWWGVGVLCVATFLVLAAAVYLYIAHIVVQPAERSVAQVEQPYPVGVSSNVLVLGNTFWGRYINDWSMASPLQQAYPFSRLSEFDRESYNAWISGLECPAVPGVTMTSAEMDSTLTFNCDPSYLTEASKWFTAFTLANNHTDNQGAEGFLTTQQALDENGIQYFGHYDPRALDDICEVLSLPVTVRMSNDVSVDGALPVAMCGYHGVFRIPTEAAVAKIAEYAAYMPVFAFPHMGAEYKPEPDMIKTTFYRSLVDAGADVVLGDHPHWIQTTESYKGHLIVYSMGNFMFDQQDTAEVVRSAAIRMALDVAPQEMQQLQSWLQVGKACTVYHDDCLEQIQKQQLKKLTISYRFGVVGTNNSGKIAKPATPEQQASIMQRLRWEETVHQLQAPYGGL